MVANQTVKGMAHEPNVKMVEVTSLVPVIIVVSERESKNIPDEPSDTVDDAFKVDVAKVGTY